MKPRPKLTHETVGEYLDWTLDNLGNLNRPELFMQAAELFIRTGANAPQAKATAHTLIEDGTLKPGQVHPGQ